MTEPTPFDDQRPSEDPAIEFDPTHFPNKVSCMAMPSLDGVIADIRITDSLGEVIDLRVPDNAVMRLNLGNLARTVKRVHPGIAEEIERDFGLSIVRCRIVLQQDDLTRIALPTLTGDEVEITVENRFIAKSM